MSAAIVAAKSIIAPPVSVARKSRTGAARLRAHAVRPLNRCAGAAAIAGDYRGGAAGAAGGALIDGRRGARV